MPDFTEMNKDNKSNNSTKSNIVGKVIATFFIGTIMSGLIIFIFFTTFGTFTEVGPLMVIYLSPVIGGIAAVITGIRSSHLR